VVVAAGCGEEGAGDDEGTGDVVTGVLELLVVVELVEVVGGSAVTQAPNINAVRLKNKTNFNRNIRISFPIWIS
jgi:hypothetical protein